MTDEIGKFFRPNLFSIPVKNTQTLGFWASQNCNLQKNYFLWYILVIFPEIYDYLAGCI